MIRFSGESLFERISKRLERTTNKQLLHVEANTVFIQRAFY